MVNRIKELILNEQLNSGSFADAIGVQRSSMSHILNGRNNPSLDFVIKTLQRFPRLNPEWLLMGVGSMYRNDHVTVNQVIKEPSIFDPIPEPLPQPKVVKEEKVVDIQPVESRSKEKFVDKVLIFYSDHTFAELIPREEKEM